MSPAARRRLLLACAGCGETARTSGPCRLRRGNACCWLVPPWRVDPGSVPVRSRNLGSRFVHLLNEGSASVHLEPIFAPGWTYAEPGMRQWPKSEPGMCQWPKSEPGSSSTDETRTRESPMAKIRTWKRPGGQSSHPNRSDGRKTNPGCDLGCSDGQNPNPGWSPGCPSGQNPNPEAAQ